MRTRQILNPALAEAVARLGHGDRVAVTDAGCPIPDGVRRVDLAVDYGIPSVPQVLTVLLRHVLAEHLTLSEELREFNPHGYTAIQEAFRGSGATLAITPHDHVMTELIPTAKLVVRSGDFTPWGNLVFVASTEPYAWFPDEEVARGRVMPEAYRERIARMEANELPS
ncbi:MAG: D-ribose pyranase [Propioniciclava sp.]